MTSITAAKSPPFSASTACQSSSWINCAEQNLTPRGRLRAILTLCPHECGRFLVPPAGATAHLAVGSRSPVVPKRLGSRVPHGTTPRSQTAALPTGVGGESVESGRAVNAKRCLPSDVGPQRATNAPVSLEMRTMPSTLIRSWTMRRKLSTTWLCSNECIACASSDAVAPANICSTNHRLSR